MKHATVCYLLKTNPHPQILLGYKKTGFGAGKYNGPGGKVEPGETVAAAAIREVEEEVGIKIQPGDIRAMGKIEFLFPYKPEWDQIVYIFTAEKWTGEPVESRELKPEWFRVDEIPYQAMWQDSQHWTPRVLAGQPVDARISFKQDLETVDEVIFR